MKPIGPLMKEHRLIERMVNILSEQQKLITESRQINTSLISIAVDFFRTYANRTHHGKEEDILFRELENKQLSQKHKQIMQELIQEHIVAGRMVAALDEANKRYSLSNSESLREAEKLITEIVNFYPEHIKKEDKRFFYPCLAYLTKEEQDGMLEAFWEFDRKIIHEKYQNVVDELTTIKL